MTDPTFPDERLAIRTKPSVVCLYNRKALILLTGTARLFVLGAIAIAFRDDSA